MAGKDAWSQIGTQVNTCALTGAAAFFAGIPDAAIVINGPLWCYFYALRYLERTYPAIMKRCFSTQPDDSSVVYGTEECLLETLAIVQQTMRPSVLFIENSCSISLIGDDIAGIASSANLAYPVVCLDSGGLSGGFWEGYEAAADAYFKTLAPPKSIAVESGRVNLLGCTPSYYNGSNDIEEIKRLLHLAGYKIGLCPGAGSTVEAMQSIGAAECNLVIHGELGLKLAKTLQQLYKTPYTAPLPPYGIEGTIRWLQSIEFAIKSPVGSGKITAELTKVQQSKKVAVGEMQRVWGEPWFDHILLAAPSSVAFGIAEALQNEWVDTGSLTVLPHDAASCYSPPATVNTIFSADKDERAIIDYFSCWSSGLILGSSQEKSLLQKESVGTAVFQNIAFPIYDEVLFHNRPFMGLRGFCHMTERLWNHYIALCQQDDRKNIQTF